MIPFHKHICRFIHPLNNIPYPQVCIVSHLGTVECGAPQLALFFPVLASTGCAALLPLWSSLARTHKQHFQLLGRPIHAGTFVFAATANYYDVCQSKITKEKLLCAEELFLSWMCCSSCCSVVYDSDYKCSLYTTTHNTDCIICLVCHLAEGVIRRVFSDGTDYLKCLQWEYKTKVGDKGSQEPDDRCEESRRMWRLKGGRRKTPDKRANEKARECPKEDESKGGIWPLVSAWLIFIIL